MRMIHCADLHLDSSMESNFDGEMARERNLEVLFSFKRMITYAKTNEVKLIMISGDLFDEERVSFHTLESLKELINEAGEIEFLYLRGNHDVKADYFSGCENVKCFSDEWRSYPYGNVCISGIEMNDRNFESMYESLELNQNDINIVMLHGQIATQSGYDLINLKKLQNKNIDYLALGHLHSFRCEKLDVRGRYCYSGCLEGRGFDECGEKGFVLLDENQGVLESSFIPFSKRTLHEISVDISGLFTLNEILDRVRKELSDINKNDLVKLVLTGTYYPETNKDLSYISRELNEEFYFVKIKDASRLFIDINEYQYDKSLKGEFIRMVMSSDKNDEDKERIISYGLAALRGEKNFL